MGQKLSGRYAHRNTSFDVQRAYLWLARLMTRPHDATRAWGSTPHRRVITHCFHAHSAQPASARAMHPSDSPAAAPALGTQRIVKIRRDYNAWVADETLEDYALRFTPRSFRKWSEFRVANTALGAISFLALEAIGGSLALNYGFANTVWAIVVTSVLIFLTGLPISYYAANCGVDMDLLTRGAGFGYLGSTVTSLIYAGFTFIFFALEAAIMSLALEMYFHMPIAVAYLISAFAIVPFVTFGITLINRLQSWTQPVWIVLLVAPYIAILIREPHLFSDWATFAGYAQGGREFGLMPFGAACTVIFALVVQIGEQVDFLRFLPPRTAKNRVRWWCAMLAAGPGWIVPGALKMLGGAFLMFLALQNQIDPSRATEPTQMYLVAFRYVFDSPGFALAATTLFVIVSQVKINVTNAYAGSLAWSNFFARLTHSHPGRVVWLAFTAIALMLMELDVFTVLGKVLGLYANLAISWLMAVVADLVINKPLGLSPRGIEFRRAYLYDVNPVGVGAMGAASVLSIAAHLGAFGPLAQAFSALIALVTAFVASRLIAWDTKGRYYIARRDDASRDATSRFFAAGEAASARGEGVRYRLLRCCICERDYEGPDMAHCPAYQGPICSLCCSLDARCGDLCKPDARLATKARAAVHALLPRRLWPAIDGGLGAWLALMLPVALLLAGVCALLYQQELRVLGNAA